MSARTETAVRRTDDRPERNAEGISCSCGGYADIVSSTREEIAAQGCGREYHCCARAFVCRICKTRLVCDAAAPEMD